MNTLHMMVGLPRSGKSTKARQLGYPVVECDAIRKSLGTYPFIEDSEDTVWYIAKVMVKSLFNAGHKDVILDSTNLTKLSRDKWKNPLYTIKYYVVDTDMDTCIDRAIKNNQEYLVPVINRMSKTIDYNI